MLLVNAVEVCADWLALKAQASDWPVAVGGGASVDDMGDGSLPGRNSLTLIVKGGERER